MTQVIEKVGVVGCGLMGSGIAEVAARAGLDVTVTESSPSAAEAGMARVATSMKRALTSGRLTDADHDAAWGRLAFGHQLDALVDCDLVIEAVAEDEAMKIEVFGQLDEVCKPQAVLASNTSSIPIMKL
ncbi:MAG TPA: 3-hydroxyacyl-CoA dehydrogenase NAD-binding domain-containing protein, partial [Ilumatobacteraceae bacterium]|nr:3-hydroxyacyl-CoA dehydrogenase NAD-binding domain-containing protein [Ilumatobacteraceae bacterium]